jgi:aminoglycoside 2''-phosphotransferase
MDPYSKHPRWEWNNLDHSSAGMLLAKHLPDATQSRLEPFGSGDFTLAFKQGNQVIRVARHPEAANALKRESCVLARIAASLPLAVPRPTYYAISRCPPFTMHEEVAGEFLTREEWENMPTVEREKAAADLATFLRALHSLPVEIGRACGLDRLNLPHLARSLRKKISSTIHGLLDQQMQARITKVLEDWSLPSSSEPQYSALLHCDIGPGHVLYSPSTGLLTGVIDFGDLLIGDPARDFIYIYEDYGPLILEEVLARYAGTDASLMMPAIRKWYLFEAITWTVEQFITQSYSNVEHGLAEIRRELADL